MPTRGIATTGALLILLLHPRPAPADEALGSRVVELRVQVDEVSADISALRADLANELRSIAAREADLELEVARAEARVRAQQASLDQYHQESDVRNVQEDELRPVVLRAIGDLETAVETSLPYKREERLESLDQLRRDFEGGVLAPEMALSRLWQFVEDELRLTGIVELNQQVVVVDGEEFLADVAHVGMVDLFFATEGGRCGRAVGSGGGYRFEFLEDKDDKKAVQELMDRLRKQIRTGYIELPLQSLGEVSS